jgi:hypothetical protein
LLFTMSPVTPAEDRIPTAPLELAIAIVPWLVTELLVFWVTAVPLAGLTEPVELMVTLSGLPLFAVEVRTGVVTAVEMVAAEAGVKAGAATAARAAVDRSR